MAIIHYGLAKERAEEEADRLSRLPKNIDQSKMGRGVADILNSSYRHHRTFMKLDSIRLNKLAYQSARGGQR